MRDFDGRIRSLEQTVAELLRRLQRYESAPPLAPAVPPGIINFRLKGALELGGAASAVVLDNAGGFVEGPDISVWDAHNIFEGGEGYEGYAAWRPWGRWEIIQMTCEAPEDEGGGE